MVVESPEALARELIEVVCVFFRLDGRPLLRSEWLKLRACFEHAATLAAERAERTKASGAPGDTGTPLRVTTGRQTDGRDRE